MLAAATSLIMMKKMKMLLMSFDEERCHGGLIVVGYLVHYILRVLFINGSTAGWIQKDNIS